MAWLQTYVLSNPVIFGAIDYSAVQCIYQMQGRFRPLSSCYTSPSMEMTTRLRLFIVKVESSV